MLKDIHQTVEKKQKPGTPKTPSIVIPGPSKKGLEDCEGSNVLMDESFIEIPLERNSGREEEKLKSWNRKSWSCLS
jgi:hypothetical protein